MNVKGVIKQLKKEYPGKVIIENKNKDGVTTEIICEIEKTSDHPEYSVAVAVIDSSILHYHKKITETYKVLKGTLTVFKTNEEVKLEKGDELIIKPGEIHSNLGNESWIECVSNPGWEIDDYIKLDPIIKKYTDREIRTE
jgi:mannose-6-phosphate isomerase-like protein (cupin superfamily)